MALLLPVLPARRSSFRSHAILAAGGLLILLSLPAAAAGPATPLWIHVSVDEGGPDGARVRMTVPLSLAQAVLPFIDKDGVCRGKVHLDGDVGLTQRELRVLRAAVAAAREDEYVPVLMGDDLVLVTRSGRSLLLRVEDEDSSVKIRVPLKLVDAFLQAESAASGEIELAVALTTLEEQGAGELVTVDDGEDQVRVWLDTNPDHD